jgi:ribosomal protein S18 acetylase RimI-like enzyme
MKDEADGSAPFHSSFILPPSSLRTMRAIQIDTLTYRPIDLELHLELAVQNHYRACVASFGDDRRYEGRAAYLRYLREQVEVFPEGSVLAFEGRECVGQLELRVPYGLATGYVGLYYVTPAFRGRGYGRRLNAYAERYFRSWEATRVELHVSPTNSRAVSFYQRLGYDFTNAEPPGAALRRMAKALDVTVP